MKNGWQTKKLGEVCHDLTRTAHLTAGRSIDEGGYDPMAIKSDEVSRVKSEMRQDCITPEEGWTTQSARMFRKGHSLGACREQLLGKWASSIRADDESSVCGIRSETSSSPRSFSFYFLSSEACWQRKTARATRRPNIDSIKTSEISKFPLPPLPEQQRIVGILDEAFEGIATAKANAEKNLQNARALFESHLHSVFTHRGEGWVEKRVERNLSRSSLRHCVDTAKTSVREVIHVGAENIRAHRLCRLLSSQLSDTIRRSIT